MVFLKDVVCIFCMVVFFGIVVILHFVIYTWTAMALPLVVRAVLYFFCVLFVQFSFSKKVLSQM